MVIVDLDDPLKPKLAARGPARRRARRRRCSSATSSSPTPRASTAIDVTDPDKPRHVSSARACRSPTRGGIYVARTYAYVAAGAEGLAIVDVEQARSAARST